jgi:antitoxin component of MazEF toxin-antitoxin module
MTAVTIGRWGRSLALRVPADVAQHLRLREGERVELELADGDLLVRRAQAKEAARERARAAARAILAQRPAQPLDRRTLREMIDEGRA